MANNTSKTNSKNIKIAKQKKSKQIKITKKRIPVKKIKVQKSDGLWSKIINTKIWKTTEHIVDKSIPWLVLLLGGIIVSEFTMDLHHYETYINAIDTFIIVMFVLDLIFKYQHVQGWKFVKSYWLDILAVFPFYLFFRVFSEAANVLHVGELFAEGQTLVHESLEIEKEGSRIAKELEKVGKITREAELAKASKFTRILRTIQRSPRLLKAKVFFQWEKYKKRHLKKKK